MTYSGLNDKGVALWNLFLGHSMEPWITLHLFALFDQLSTYGDSSDVPNDWSKRLTPPTSFKICSMSESCDEETLFMCACPVSHLAELLFNKFFIHCSLTLPLPTRSSLVSWSAGWQTFVLDFFSESITNCNKQVLLPCEIHGKHVYSCGAASKKWTASINTSDFSQITN